MFFMRADRLSIPLVVRNGLLMLCMVCMTCTTTAKADPAAALREKHASLVEQLQQNQFKRPLVLESTETSNRLKGDIYATVDYPFRTLSSLLRKPQHWCDVMILHINTKYCHAMIGASGATLSVNIGKKTPQAIAAAERVNFNFSATAATPEYFEVVLNAKEGPLGTSDYHIRMEAVALPNAKTFLHLTYAYTSNFAGRLAMQTYLGTIGRGKVGFTAIGKQEDGQLEYIDGVRGVTERNTMRYYLAIDAFLATWNVAPAVQLEQRLQYWFAATERYPRQLHEMDREAYLEMKRTELIRQQTIR